MERLPDDVLYEIFKVTPGFRKSPIRISHCCRRWRSTALNSPILWTCVIFAWYAPLDWLAACVDRSQQRTLNVYIDLGHEPMWRDYRVWCDSYFKEGMDILEPHAYRWGSLHISSPNTRYLHRLLSLRYYTRLTFLHVFLSDRVHAGDTGILQVGIEHMPALQVLECGGNGVSLLRVDQPTWWTSPIFHIGLRRLELSGGSLVSVDACLGVLQRCPYLEELCLDFHFRHLSLSPEFWSKEHLGSPVVANHLYCLRLGALSYPEIYFLARISAPNLTRTDWRIPHELVPRLASLNPFPFPLLESLYIGELERAWSETYHAYPRELHVILAQLPELRVLTIDAVQGISKDDTRQLLEGLSTTCPSLTVLNLPRWSGEGYVSEVLLQVIKARQASGSLQNISALAMAPWGLMRNMEMKWLSANVKNFHWGSQEIPMYEPGLESGVGFLWRADRVTATTRL